MEFIQLLEIILRLYLVDFLPRAFRISRTVRAVLAVTDCLQSCLLLNDHFHEGVALDKLMSHPGINYFYLCFTLSIEFGNVAQKLPFQRRGGQLLIILGY